MKKTKKNKQNRNKVLTKLKNEYVEDYKKEMLETLTKADCLGDEIIFDGLSSYDIVIEEVTKAHLRWTDFLLEKGIKFGDVIDEFQQEIYDKYGLLPSGAYCDVRARTYNTRRPGANRKGTYYFTLDLEGLKGKGLRNAQRMLNRLKK